MSDLDLVTAELVRDWATGTLEGWLDGYTDSTYELPQFRIRSHEDGVYAVHEVGFGSTLASRRFRVTVNVEELV